MAGGKCKACQKVVYINDPQMCFDGTLVHKSCAKCEDCNCQITLSNFAKDDSPEKLTLLCKTHYFKRFREGGKYLGGDKFEKKPSNLQRIKVGASQSSKSPANTTDTVKRNHVADYTLDEVTQYHEVEDHHVEDNRVDEQFASKIDTKEEHDEKTDKADEASESSDNEESNHIPAPNPPVSVLASTNGTKFASRVVSPDKAAVCSVTIAQRKEMLLKQSIFRSVGSNALPSDFDPLSVNKRPQSERLPKKFGGGNPCAACNRSVYKVEELLALNQTWHKSCFRCGCTQKGDGCNKLLSLDNYRVHGKHPFCGACHRKVGHTIPVVSPRLPHGEQTEQVEQITCTTPSGLQDDEQLAEPMSFSM